MVQYSDISLQHTMAGLEEMTDGLKKVTEIIKNPEAAIQKAAEEQLAPLKEKVDAIKNTKDRLAELSKAISSGEFMASLAKIFDGTMFSSILSAIAGGTFFSKEEDTEDSHEHKGTIHEQVGETFVGYFTGGRNQERMKKRTDTQLKAILEREGLKQYVEPVPIKPSDNFAQPRVQGHLHEGRDYAVAIGTPIASVEGKVTYAKDTGGAFGKLVIVEKGNLKFYYAHLSSLDVKAGEHVSAGTIVGKSGNTGRSSGPHLHHEVHYGGHNGSRLDPAQISKVLSA